MSYRKLLLKSIKLILPGTIGCMIGIIIFYGIFQSFNSITIKYIFIYVIGFIISFITLTIITWVVYIIKNKKKY